MDPQSFNSQPVHSDTASVPPVPPPTINHDSVPKKSNGWAVALMAIFVLLALGAVAFLYYQNQQLKNIIVSYQTPVVSPTPTATPDPTANWKTYSNTVEKFAFKYPSTWSINTADQNGDGQGRNISIKLTNALGVIRLNVDMYGIGGVGQDFQGTPVTILGNNFYKYKITGADGKTMIIGITDELKGSLGLFRINGKTYGFSLSYPAGTDGSIYEKDFDQILTTFKFIGPTNSPSASPTP